MNIGWLVLSSSRTAVRRLCGQFWAAERICRPLIGPHQRAHLAAADEEIRDIRRGYAGLGGQVLEVLPDEFWLAGFSHMQFSRNLTACLSRLNARCRIWFKFTSGKTEQNDGFVPATLTSHHETRQNGKRAALPHFIRPAAVNARVMMALPSIARRRGCGGGSAGRCGVGCGTVASSGVRSGAEGRAGFAAWLGAASAVRDSRIRSVKPKKFAMWYDDEIPASIRNAPSVP